MTDFLLELLSEEIPARMQAKAAKDLAFLIGEALVRAGLPLGESEAYATPRRLALIVRGLPLQTDPLSDEIKGPKSSAPTQAIDGFLRKNGLSFSQLIERNGVLFARIDKPGRDAVSVLAEAIPQVIRGFPWPKSMRWGAASVSTSSLRWVRPLKGIVALFGEDVVPCEVDTVVSGAATVGHRFRHPGPITIGSTDDYEAKLRACHVVLDPAERMAMIRDGAAAVAAAAGLTVVPDEGLVAENAGLTEWPVPLLGRFDPAFLEVPREVIQLTMRTNQKYFACTDAGRALAPAFVCVANIDAADGGAAIVAGNARVLAARLSDARFFWEQDLKVPLAEQAAKLDQIVFHEKLGTVADKVARVAKLARWLVESDVVKPLPFRGGVGGGASPRATDPVERPHPNPSPEGEGLEKARLADLAEQAALLCKADLVTGMVGEFPELQGVMGGYYARAEGLPAEVADAIRDHYKPVGQGDEVPTAPVTAAVSLADKLDSLVCFFSVEERPTGSRDPFALRRAAIAFIQIILENDMRINLASGLLRASFEWYNQSVQSARLGAFTDAYWELERARRIPPDLDKVEELADQRPLDQDSLESQGHAAVSALLDFFADRFKVQQREAGVRHDLIDAVFALGGEDDLIRLLARVRALQAFVETGEGRDLLAGYKRAANILKKEGWSQDQPSPRERGEGPDGVAVQGEGESGRAADAADSPSPSPPAAAFPPPAAGGGRVGLAPAEAALVAALDNAEPLAAQAVEREDFDGAMRALASLRAPIDRFFEDVTVNDPAPAVRARRLDLLARIRGAVHKVADFSKIEG